MWSRWVDATNTPQLDANERIRRRYFISALTLVVLASAVATVAFLAAGSVMQAIAGSPVPVFACVSLVWHRRTHAIRGPVRLSLVAAAVSLSASALAQTPAQNTNIAFLSVLPLVAVLLLGHHEAKRWAVGLLGWGLFLFWCSSEGYTLSIRDPSPEVSEAMTYSFLLLVVWSLADVYFRLTSMALTEIDEAGRAKNAFLANISHEIRTPMNGVLGLTQMLLTEPMAPEHTASLELIHRSGQQMVTLLNDLLDATKAQAGKLTVERHDFDLWQLLVDVRGLFGPIAQQKGVQFTLDHPPSLPRYVSQDSARLRQVLSNLISNALKFTAHGSVVLRATPVGDAHVRFEVEDTGIGISAELASRLFKPFEQAEGTANRRQGGTGLGLALSQQLVTLMGGHIDVESMPERGARFFFTVPCGAAASSTAVLPREALRRGERDEVVLIVDDNPINLLVASKLVEKAGFHSRPVSSGAEALRLLATEAVSLVLMDCHMPELDGFETTREIRKLGTAGATVPVVALTASTLPDELAACLSAGMNEVLTKPVSLEALVSVLDRLAPPAPQAT